MPQNRSLLMVNDDCLMQEQKKRWIKNVIKNMQFNYRENDKPICEKKL